MKLMMNVLLKVAWMMSAVLYLSSPDMVEAFNQYKPFHNPPPGFQLVPPARPLRPTSFVRTPMFPGFVPAQPGRGIPAQSFPHQQPLQPFPPITPSPFHDEFMPPIPEPFREAFNPDVNPFQSFPTLVAVRPNATKQKNVGSSGRPALPPQFFQPGFLNKLPSVPIRVIPSEDQAQAPKPVVTTAASADSNNGTTMAAPTVRPIKGRKIVMPHPELVLPKPPVPIGVSVEPLFEHPVIIMPPLLEPLSIIDENVVIPNASTEVPMTSTITEIPMTNLLESAQTDVTTVPAVPETELVNNTTIALSKRSVTEEPFVNSTGSDTASSGVIDHDNFSSSVIDHNNSSSSIVDHDNSSSRAFDNDTSSSKVVAIDTSSDSTTASIAVSTSLCNCSSVEHKDSGKAEPSDKFQLSTSRMGNVSTNFSCKGRSYGYYADVETDCLVFHHCIPLSDHILRVSFRCPDETVFNQMHRVCMQPTLSIPCRDAPKFYSVSDEFAMMAGLEVSSREAEFVPSQPFFVCPGHFPGSYRDPRASTCDTFVRCSEVLINGEIFLIGEIKNCPEGQIFHGTLNQCISVPSDFSCVAGLQRN